MKRTDYIQELGRPISYYPRLAPLLGGVTEAILFCQLLYWSERCNDEQGWIYKTREELTKETGLSRREQETARKVLQASGVLHEKYDRLHHRKFYRISADAFEMLWDGKSLFNPSPEGAKRAVGTARNAPSPKHETAQGTSPNAPSYKNIDYTETTTDIKPSAAAEGGVETQCPDKIPGDVWKRVVDGWDRHWTHLHGKPYLFEQKDIASLAGIIKLLKLNADEMGDIVKRYLREPETGLYRGHPLTLLRRDLNHFRTSVPGKGMPHVRVKGTDLERIANAGIAPTELPDLLAGEGHRRGGAKPAYPDVEEEKRGADGLRDRVAPGAPGGDAREGGVPVKLAA